VIDTFSLFKLQHRENKLQKGAIVFVEFWQKGHTEKNDTAENFNSQK